MSTDSGDNKLFPILYIPYLCDKYFTITPAQSVLNNSYIVSNCFMYFNIVSPNNNVARKKRRLFIIPNLMKTLIQLKSLFHTNFLNYPMHLSKAIFYGLSC